MPSSLHGAERNPQQLPRLFLCESLVPQEVHHFLLFIRQRFDVLVELGPFGGVLRLVARPVQRSPGVISRLAVRVVICSDPVRAEVMFGEVEQFPPHLHRRQIEKVPNRFDLNLGQRPVEANERVLEHVIGLLPAAKVRVAVEHLAGEAKQPVAGMIEQGLPGLLLPGSCKVDQVLNLRIGCLCSHKWNPRHGLSRWNQAILSGFPAEFTGQLAVRQPGRKGVRKKSLGIVALFPGECRMAGKARRSVPPMRMESQTMRVSQLVCLIGLASLMAGCGGKPEPPAIPQGASAPAPPESGSPSRTRKPSTASKSRPGTTVNENDPNLMEWNQRLTALRKIRAGMTIEQVEGIIGIADETDEKDLGELNPAKAGQTLSTLTWRGDEDGDAIIIGFVNERLKDTSYIKVTAAKK